MTEEKDIKQGSSPKGTPQRPPQKQDPGQFVDRGAALPQGYGETRLVLLPRDPKWAHAYWEISRELHQDVEKKHGKDVWSRSKCIIRVYDVTDIIFNGTNAHKQSDINVDLAAGNWYFRVPEQDRNYLAEIGLLTSNGEFIALARSNTIHIPREKISELMDEDWMIIKEEFKFLIQKAGLDKTGLSSQTIIRMIIQRLETILSSSNITSHMGSSSLTRKKKE